VRATVATARRKWRAHDCAAGPPLPKREGLRSERHRRQVNREDAPRSSPLCPWNAIDTRLCPATIDG
jgi:hypothetical protein